MKQVVIIAPQFPPNNFAATHRSRYFAMHLAKFGWQPTVLTIDPSYYEEKPDNELAALLPAGLDIIRTKAMSIRPFRLFGDLSLRAFYWHYQALVRLIRSRTVDLIYIPVPPNYSVLLGYLMNRRFGVPYAIDYIDPIADPWPGSEKIFSRAWITYLVCCWLEPLALRRASFLTAVAPGYYAGALKRNPWFDPKRCFGLPYGAEKEDFAYLDKYPRKPYLFDPSDGNFHIVYAGAMLPKAFSTLEALFAAVVLIRKDNPGFAQKLRFHFIGTGSRPADPESYNILPYALRYGLEGIVTEHAARLPFIDVLNHLKHSSAVLVMGSSEPHYTPSKVFQAVLSRKPVLGLLHSQSTAISILRESNSGTVVAFNQNRPAGQCVQEITQAIYQTVNLGSNLEKVNWEAFSAYSAESMTKQLAGIFDSMLKNKDERKEI